MGWLVYAVPERDAEVLENWMEIVRDSHGKDLFEFEIREPSGLKWMGVGVVMVLVRYGKGFPDWKREVIDETCMSLLELAEKETGLKSLCLKLLPSWTRSLGSCTIQVRT